MLATERQERFLNVTIWSFSFDYILQTILYVPTQTTGNQTSLQTIKYKGTGIPTRIPTQPRPTVAVANETDSNKPGQRFRGSPTFLTSTG